MIYKRVCLKTYLWNVYEGKKEAHVFEEKFARLSVIFLCGFLLQELCGL